MIRTICLAFMILVVSGCGHLSKSPTHQITFDEHFDNFPKSKDHVRKIVDHCWKISLELRSNPDLQVIDQGHYKTAKCFEDEYIKLFLMIDVLQQKSEQQLHQQFSELQKIHTEIMMDVALSGNDFISFMPHNFQTNIVNTDYSLLMQDIVMSLIYRVHFLDKYPGDNREKINKAIQYLDNFTP